MKGSFLTGAGYFFRGLQRLNEPGLRRYVAIPILVNIVLMSAATWWGVHLLDQWLGELSAWLPSWLNWLYWVVLPVAVVVLLASFAYFFSTVLVILMAPFNGLLSEQVDRRLGNNLPSESIWSLVRRTLWRELVKLAYLLPRYLGLFILGLIPVVQIVTPFLWVLFTCWVIALQYADYAFDNRQLSFKKSKQDQQQQALTMLGFGAVVVFLLTIPIVNWFVIPAAIIGATQMCHEQKIIRVAN